MVIVKVLPFPGALSTEIVPFMRRAMFCAMGMPRPVPWIWLVRLSSARMKGSNMIFWKERVMPMPLSLMINS